MSGPIITRAPGPPTVAAVTVEGLADLAAHLAREAPGARPVVADLTLGAWRGQAAAHDLCRQLGVAPPEPVQPTPAAHAGGEHGDYVDTIGRLVDTESAGDGVVTSALAAARRVCGALQDGPARAVVVIAPRFGNAWEREDLLFAGFLARGLHGSRHAFLLAAGPGATLPGWRLQWRAPVPPAASPPVQAGSTLAALVPGVLDADTAALLGGEGMLASGAALPLDGGCVLPDPALRHAPAVLGELVFDDLAERAAGAGWLRAYARCHGTPAEADQPLLCDEAAVRFAEGGYGIAARLLQVARVRAPNEAWRASVDVQLQGMRIALMRFAEAAAEPEPAAELPPGLRGALLQCRAWGLVMTGRAREAEPCFDEAIRLLAGSTSERYELYLLNIAALTQLRLGRLERALEMEKRIEAALAARARPDWHLGYINAINQARLYRRAGQLDEAERYYARAFQGTLGLRSPSDLVYVNVCWAQLATQAGRPREAFAGWLRAALHWVADEVPEALAPRVARAIVEGEPPVPEALPEAISAALLTRLLAAAGAAGVDAARFSTVVAPERAPVFRRPDAVPPGACQVAAGQPGWGVLACPSHRAQPVFRGPAWDALCQALAAYAAAECPPLAGAATLLVDACGGTEMPGTAAELLDSAVRWDARRVWFSGRDADLSAEQAHLLRASSRTRLAAGLDFVRPARGQLEVHFKRYRPPVVVAASEVPVLDWIGSGASREELVARGGPGVLDSLGRLEREGVVTTRLAAVTA
jgi:tetratricopeptide (TPR) repeat protein